MQTKLQLDKSNSLTKLTQAVELKAQAEHLGFFKVADTLQRLIVRLQYILGIVDRKSGTLN